MAGVLTEISMESLESLKLSPDMQSGANSATHSNQSIQPLELTPPHSTDSTDSIDSGRFTTDEIIPDQPLGSARRIRIITIGAGASGLNMIRTARKHLNNYEHVVYEKNPDVGGTWYENRYPGCKCDIPSHNYQFSWRPNTDWSAFFASSQEIHSYVKTCCDQERLWDSVRLSHQVVHAEWDDSRVKWIVKIKKLETGVVIEDECDFLLDGSGILKLVGSKLHFVTSC